MADMLLLALADGVATVTLNRPEIHNAFDDRVIAELTDRFRALDTDPAVHAVVLAANGASFSAGGDLNWMRRMANYSEAENIADAQGLAVLMRTIDRLSKPTIAKVQGSAFAGGVGLIAVSDIVIAAAHAEFAITEVRIGLIPAVIGPYLVRAMGVREARRLSLTAERFGAEEARRVGLVHEVVPADALDAAVARQLAALGRNSPAAMAAAKQFSFEIDRPLDDDVIEHSVHRIARQRASPEGIEGLTAFLEKRKPSWMRGT